MLRGVGLVIAGCALLGACAADTPDENPEADAAETLFDDWLDIIEGDPAVEAVHELGVVDPDQSGRLNWCNTDPIDPRPPLVRLFLKGGFDRTDGSEADILALFEAHGWSQLTEPVSGPDGLSSASLTKDMGSFTARAAVFVLADRIGTDLDLEIYYPNVCEDGFDPAPHRVDDAPDEA